MNSLVGDQALSSSGCVGRHPPAAGAVEPDALGVAVGVAVEVALGVGAGWGEGQVVATSVGAVREDGLAWETEVAPGVVSVSSEPSTRRSPPRTRQ